MWMVASYGTQSRVSNLIIFTLLLFFCAEIGYGFTITSQIPLSCFRNRFFANGLCTVLESPALIVVYRRHHPSTNVDTATVAFATSSQDEPASSSLREEAEALMAKARQLREEIEREKSQDDLASLSMTVDGDSPANTAKSTSPVVLSSPWTVGPSPNTEGDETKGEGDGYRLYVDVGREDGTWMDPRWGASGKRIPFTLDVKFLTNRLADPTVAALMVNDNARGQSSKVYALETAKFARLRDGFDRMPCYGGAYRIDNINGRYTVRMVIQVEGTKADQNYMYGDVSIPQGCLYFSLPCFGARTSQLSTKEGPVTVRQYGWHTGWRREESRILGVFSAKPISLAQQRDPY